MMLPSGFWILVRRQILLSICIKIIRPPLHHIDPFFQILSLMNKGGTHAVSFLMAHLLFNRLFNPQSRLTQRAARHRP